MIKIGLTGGIGSGKTTVSRIFQALGYPVYISDTRASWLINHRHEIKRALIALFGESVYLTTGELDKKKFASLIFNDKKRIDQVNKIVHPVVMEDFLAWSESQNTPFLFFESAILFEAGLTPLFDHIITVTADRETRILRAMKRDSVSREKIIERINNQLPDTEKCLQSDLVIHNNDSDYLLEQVIEIVKKLKA
ncbi:dephospho-CoA kinase [Gabonibacter chumensis]|uniref:dephospho-CoA kinase n=1 Tax=Gabonibacter chumensis TaxID=2972474 RepID=UPI00257460A8|nr:dephospho-CoA kinase [Gabonibacter chumensis]MCR9011729.1 dephospho-CoA kinase [Gabonibacter chumensis]